VKAIDAAMKEKTAKQEMEDSKKGDELVGGELDVAKLQSGTLGWLIPERRGCRRPAFTKYRRHVRDARDAHVSSLTERMLRAGGLAASASRRRVPSP